MTLDVNSPEHDALIEAFEGMADLESQEANRIYTFPATNREFLYFRAGYELGRKGGGGEVSELRPWQVGRVHKGFDGPFDWGIFNHEEDLIATVWGSGECEKADAQKIAFAPEMLEALERLVEAAGPQMVEPDLALEFARSVVRKARGEA